MMNSEKLEKIRLAMLTSLRDELQGDFATIDDWDVDVGSDAFLDITKELAIRIRGFVYGEEFETAGIRYPRDWWQHFKEQCFPKWAKRRWPVKYRVDRFEARALYPQLSSPELNPPVHLTGVKRGDG